MEKEAGKPSEEPRVACVTVTRRQVPTPICALHSLIHPAVLEEPPALPHWLLKTPTPFPPNLRLLLL